MTPSGSLGWGPPRRGGRYWIRPACPRSPAGPAAGPPRPVVHLVRDCLRVRGPVTVVAAACASGNVALAQAAAWVRLGWADAVLAGAADLILRPLAMACFNNMRVLSRRHDRPAAAARPFDRDRDGFVPGEGGAVFLLEPAAAARRRGARPYAEL